MNSTKNFLKNLKCEDAQDYFQVLKFYNWYKELMLKDNDQDLQACFKICENKLNEFKFNDK